MTLSPLRQVSEKEKYWASENETQRRSKAGDEKLSHAKFLHSFN